MTVMKSQVTKLVYKKFHDHHVELLLFPSHLRILNLLSKIFQSVRIVSRQCRIMIISNRSALNSSKLGVGLNGRSRPRVLPGLMRIAMQQFSHLWRRLIGFILQYFDWLKNTASQFKGHTKLVQYLTWPFTYNAYLLIWGRFHSNMPTAIVFDFTRDIADYHTTVIGKYLILSNSQNRTLFDFVYIWALPKPYFVIAHRGFLKTFSVALLDSKASLFWLEIYKFAPTRLTRWTLVKFELFVFCAPHLAIRSIREIWLTFSVTPFNCVVNQWPSD